MDGIAGVAKGATVTRAWLAAIAAAVTLLLYAAALDSVPPYLHHDEVFFANQAHSIATTGRDTEGRLLPASFEVYEGSWFQPVLVYFSAPFLKVLPLSETTVRLPSVVIGVIDVVLMFFVAAAVFRSTTWGLVAAMLLALSPAHLIHARLAMDYIYPVPFVLLWLLLLDRYLQRRTASALLFACLALGVGFFSYVAAWALMPMYLALTLAIVFADPQSPRSRVVPAIAGFGAPLLLAVPFMLMHPDTLMRKWRVYGPAGQQSLDPLQQLREFFSWLNLTDRVGLYFDFLNPSYLFMSGGVKIVSSTRIAGVFLLPLAIFIPIGIYQLLRHHRTARNVTLVAGFFLAPIAATLISEHGAVERELEVLPFGVLLAVFGIKYLWSAPLSARLRPPTMWISGALCALSASYAVWTLARSGHLSRMTLPLFAFGLILYAIAAWSDRAQSWRPITVSLLAIAAVQFPVFYRDYLTDYPIRAGGWFEFNRRGAIELALSREPRDRPVQVFVSNKIQYFDVFWRFYCSKRQREDLQRSMHFFDPQTTPAASIPRDSLVITLTTEAGAPSSFPARQTMSLVGDVPERGGSPVFSVLVADRQR